MICGVGPVASIGEVKAPVVCGAWFAEVIVGLRYVCPCVYTGVDCEVYP